MELTEQLINILSDGATHSGEALGLSLGISRVAVWKRLKKLEEFGLEVETKKGKGYCLPGGLDLLRPLKIGDCLSNESQRHLSNVDVFFQIDSTNARLADMARTSPIKGHVCLAEQQTAGRGRRGREWYSPFGRNIYMSVGWEFEAGAAVLEGLSLAVGVALVRALASNGVAGLALKWPNDILCNGKKLAGVLIEMSGDASGACSVVVGIGLNVNMGSGVTTQIDQPWIDVASLINVNVSRNALVGSMLSELLPVLADYHERGFAIYRDEWNALDHLAMQDVELIGVAGNLTGVAHGVDATGALQVDTGEGVQLVKGGEVTLRKRA